MARPASSTATAVLAIVIGFGSALAARQAAQSRALVTPDDPIWGQDPAPTPTPTPTPAEGGQTPPGAPGGGGRGGAAQRPAPRPYAQVITPAAKSDTGIFTIHRVNDTLYYEIPKHELGKDFLLVSQLKRTTLGAGYGGEPVGNRLLRWELTGDRVLLKTVNYNVISSDGKNEVARAVDDSNLPAIVRAFNVAAYSPDGAPVIDVTSLFTTEIAELTGRRPLNGRGFDGSRSFIEKAVSFPENINTEVVRPTPRRSMRDAAAALAAVPAPAACAGTAAPC
jgi:hypothetical protein